MDEIEIKLNDGIIDFFETTEYGRFHFTISRVIGQEKTCDKVIVTLYDSDGRYLPVSVWHSLAARKASEIIHRIMDVTFSFLRFDNVSLVGEMIYPHSLSPEVELRQIQPQDFLKEDVHKLTKFVLENSISGTALQIVAGRVSQKQEETM